VNPRENSFENKAASPKGWRAVCNRRGPGGGGRLLWLGVGLMLVCGIPARAESQEIFIERGAERTSRDTTGTVVAALRQPASQELTGSVGGAVVDQTGAAVAGVRVRISREDASLSQEAMSDSDGRYSFSGIAPGPFQLTAMSTGFATATIFGTLHSGESYNAPPIELVVASASVEVRVAMSRTELAEAEIKDEEKQRVLGVVPNFYVTYDPSAFPLTPKQKFELAWKTTVDPVNFGLTGAVAGIEQATDTFNGYGQGAQGYAKRFGASYANFVTGTFIGSALLPSLFKQDPRYFYKGTGSRRSRALYAMANSVICKGDNGKWQANYSSILGGLASGGISNLYYPASDRNDAALTFENALIGIGTTAAANLLQEFVIRRLTPHAPSYARATP
jgi:Carboxypeptidase regulatory-like domain